MLSRCPACATVFRVSAAQIRAREGRVRCGHCSAVFDALDSMLDDAATEAPLPPLDAPAAPPAAHVTPASDPEPRHATLSILGASLSLPSALDSAPGAAITVADPAMPQPQPGQDAAAFAAATEQAWQTRLAQPSDLEAGRPPLPESAASATEPPEADEPLASDTLEVASASPADAAHTTDAATALLLSPGHLPDPAPDPAVERIRRELYREVPVPSRPSRAAVFGWSLLCVATLIALTVQLLYLFRGELAQAAPALRPSLLSICASLGCDIPAPHEPGLVSIDSSDLNPDAQDAHRLRLSALLRNRAGFMQAWPHLELTLTDTADKALVRKVFVPADYLPDVDTIQAGFPANSEHGVDVLIETRDVEASGYRLYVFYP